VGRCGSAREAGDCEVGAAPEKVHRADLADETGAKARHDTVNLHECDPEPMHCRCVVRVMFLVVGEGNRFDDLDRAREHADLHAEVVECSHRCFVEARDRTGFEAHLRMAPIGCADVEHMINQVEFDLETEFARVHE
jgi:hypothetical protein